VPPACVVTLASGQDNPTGLAVDDSNVYWTNGVPDGSVMKVNKMGSDAGPITLASDQGLPLGLTVSPGNVYWTNNTEPGTVLGVLTGGGTVSTLATGQGTPAYLAYQNDYLFWTNSTGDGGSGSVAKVLLKKMTDSPVSLATDQNGPLGIALDDTSVYWTNSPGGTVMKVGLDGGAAVTLAEGQATPGLLAVRAPFVFWVNEMGDVMKMLVDGGSQGAVVPSMDMDFPSAIATDETYVYWSNQGTISKAPLGGGAVTLLTVSVSPMANFMVVDDASLYWTDANTNSVMKLTPK
jgi:hypothetical protein